MDKQVIHFTSVPIPNVEIVENAMPLNVLALQGMFKNPLASPDLIGITMGASLFAAISIVLGAYIKPYIPEIFQNRNFAYFDLK